jgi:hypothetical protein
MKRMGWLKRWVVVSILGVAMATSSGCAGKQPTNRQLAIGGAAVVGLALLLYLAVAQCDKGANFCDNSPNPQ